MAPLEKTIHCRSREQAASFPSSVVVNARVCRSREQASTFCVVFRWVLSCRVCARSRVFCVYYFVRSRQIRHSPTLLPKPKNNWRGGSLAVYVARVWNCVLAGFSVKRHAKDCCAISTAEYDTCTDMSDRCVAIAPLINGLTQIVITTHSRRRRRRNNET